MKRIFKLFGLFLSAALVLIIIYAAFNVERVKRLHAVNTLFSEDKIIYNFSHMRNAFAYTPIVDTGEVEPWAKSVQALPKSYTQNGSIKSTSKWLKESKTTSFIVVKNGVVVHESYYLGTKPEDLRISWSMAKSFLSAAFGIAVNDGLIDLNRSVDSYVPALADSAYKGVTVRNVLNMSSGVKFDENYLDFWSDIKKMGRVLAIGGSMDEFTAEVKGRVREQGVARQYVSIDTHVLAMVLRAVTGKRLAEYMGEKIVSPIGFERAPYYSTDSEGNAFALGGLNITTRDYARFGQLVLNGGVWHGKRIVPEQWLKKSTVASAPQALNGSNWDYGYQWWIPPKSTDYGNDYLGRGVYGQYLYVNPTEKTVIVRTAANRKFKELRNDGSSAHQNYMALFREIAKHIQ